jgi:anti-sigma factor RsiW
MSEPADDVDDEIIVKISDYLAGTLPAADRDEVAKKIASDDTWKRTHDEMVAAEEARKHISGLRVAKPPETFIEDVTSTIHKRSAGRFFARRTLGDRVPFGVLLVVAMLALAVVGYLMWSSPTGSLKVDKKPAPTEQPSIKIRP